jgi:hypothetical protein
MKNLNTRERNRRKYLKIYQSFEKKLIGENLIWFNSLSLKSRYHLVFRWIGVKKGDPNVKVNHFLKDYKHHYKVFIHNRRNAVIDHLLD